MKWRYSNLSPRQLLQMDMTLLGDSLSFQGPAGFLPGDTWPVAFTSMQGLIQYLVQPVSTVFGNNFSPFSFLKLPPTVAILVVADDALSAGLTSGFGSFTSLTDRTMGLVDSFHDAIQRCVPECCSSPDIGRSPGRCPLGRGPIRRRGNER